jgi:hypothetical protein
MTNFNIPAGGPLVMQRMSKWLGEASNPELLFSLCLPVQCCGSLRNANVDTLSAGEDQICEAGLAGSAEPASCAMSRLRYAGRGRIG